MSRVIYMVNSRFMAQRYKLFFKLPNIFSVFLSNEESPVSRLGNFYITYIIIHVRSASSTTIRTSLRAFHFTLHSQAPNCAIGKYRGVLTILTPRMFANCHLREAGLLTSFRPYAPSRLPLVWCFQTRVTVAVDCCI